MTEPTPRRLRVGVLFGGRSAEHDVSLASARAVMDNLAGDDVEVVPIGITREGQWVSGADTWQALSAGESELEPVALLPDPAQAGSLLRLDSGPTRPAVSTRLTDIDVIFPALHGTFGEDGTVQGLLELAGVAYVGCGVLASAVAMDKVAMKALFKANDLPVLPYVSRLRREWEADREGTLDRVEAALTYPVFVKPANLGSSVGISKARNRAQLVEALDLAASYDRRLIVEQGINAREIEVSVLGNEEPRASVPGEVIPSNEWYDYAAKYLDGQSQLLIPAPIPAATADLVRSIAVEAFRVVDGSGLSRVDFLLDRDTGALWLNELNTMPGFTSISMYAKMWEASGLSYPALCRELVRLALERHADKQRTQTTR